MEDAPESLETLDHGESHISFEGDSEKAANELVDNQRSELTAGEISISVHISPTLLPTSLELLCRG